MSRRVLLLHAWYDGGWAQQARGRLHRAGHSTSCIPLTANGIAQLEPPSAGSPDVIVTVLSRALLADAHAQSLVAQLLEDVRCDCLTLIKDRELERRIPAYLRHIHAITPTGEAIATLIATLDKPLTQTPQARHGAGLVTTLVLVVALTLALAIGAILRYVVPWSASDDAVATSSSTGQTPPSMTRPPAIEQPNPPRRPEPVVPPPVPPPEPPAHLDVVPIFMGSAGSIRLRYLQGGTFMMGDLRREKPWTPHEVTLSGFWVAETEVTQAQLTSIMGTNPSKIDGGLGDDIPVQNLSWSDAIRFLNRLSETYQYEPCYAYMEDRWQWNRECNGFRLPTEAEWEYAARAGTTTDYPHGNDPHMLCDYANVADRSARAIHAGWPTAPCTDRFAHLAPVASFAPNPWHLHDMHGNAGEWVWDRFAPYSAAAVVDPTGPETGKQRVVRGGNYRSNSDGVRSSKRFRQAPWMKDARTGLRIARSQPVAHDAVAGKP